MWMSVCLIMGAASTLVRTQLAPITASVGLETGLLTIDIPASVSIPWGSQWILVVLGLLYTQLSTSESTDQSEPSIPESYVIIL